MKKVASGGVEPLRPYGRWRRAFNRRGLGTFIARDGTLSLSLATEWQSTACSPNTCPSLFTFWYPTQKMKNILGTHTRPKSSENWPRGRVTDHTKISVGGREEASVSAQCHVILSLLFALLSQILDIMFLVATLQYCSSFSNSISFFPLY